jgi:hypothetical protein
MSRVPLSELIYQGANPVRTAPGRSVYIYRRGTSTEVSLYAAETGATTVSQPLTTNSGGTPTKNGATIWIEPGAYELKVAGTAYPISVPQFLPTTKPNPTDPAFGGTGVGEDIAPALRKAIESKAEGTVEIPAGTFKLGSTVEIPAGINLIGQGVGGTFLECTAEAGGLNFAGRGGKSGGFTLNGNYSANVGLLETTCTERLFQDLKVEKCKETNWDKNESQNCSHVNCCISRSLGKGIRIRDGASNNHWYRTEIEYSVEYHISFEQTRTGTLVNQPTNNWFHGGVFERSGNDQGHAPINKMIAPIYHGSGSDNGISKCELSAQADTETSSMVIVVLDSTHGANASRLIVDGGRMVGATGTRRAYDLRENARLVVHGHLQLSAFKASLYMKDTAQAYFQNAFLEELSCTSDFENNEGTKTRDQLVFAYRRTTEQVEIDTVTNEAMRIQHKSASGYDLVIRGDGIYWPNAESFTATTGPHDCAGKGSPEGVVSARIGSIYRRTDGTEGSVLYLKVSGTGTTGWKAIA